MGFNLHPVSQLFQAQSLGLDTSEAMSQLPTVRALFSVLAVWLCLASCLSPLVDHALTPTEPTLVSLRWPWSTAERSNTWDNNTFILNHVDQRVHNTSAMPVRCSSILKSDVVPNSVAQSCLSWCRDSLGQGSAFAYAFSPVHYVLISKHASQFHILKTCWKVETASWALKWMPHVWLMYFYSLVYGSVSAFKLLYLLCSKDCKKKSGYAELPQPETSDSSGKSTGSSGVEASWSLYFGVLGTLVEPGSDLLSILTFLRNGQPHFAFYVILGLLISFRYSSDPFQLKGARAAAESLRQGFASKELLEHKMCEWTETFCSTTVQVYALLTLDVRVVQFFAALNLLGGATFSVFVSLPSQREAKWILEGRVDLENAQDIQRLKALWPRSSKAIASILPLVWAFLFYCIPLLTDEAYPETGIVAVDRPVGEWRPWILAVLIGALKLAVLVAALCYGPLYASRFRSLRKLEEEGLIHPGAEP